MLFLWSLSGSCLSCFHGTASGQRGNKTIKAGNPTWTTSRPNDTVWTSSGSWGWKTSASDKSIKKERAQCCCLVSPTDVGDQHNASGDSQVCINVVYTYRRREMWGHYQQVNTGEEWASALHMNSTSDMLIDTFLSIVHISLTLKRSQLTVRGQTICQINDGLSGKSISLKWD